MLDTPALDGDGKTIDVILKQRPVSRRLVAPCCLLLAHSLSLALSLSPSLSCSFSHTLSPFLSLSLLHTQLSLPFTLFVYQSDLLILRFVFCVIASSVECLQTCSS